jgi:hypothetical protein
MAETTESTEGNGWTIVHEQPEETVVLSETQGRTQLNPAVIRAEKQINGSLVTVEAPTEELLQIRIQAVEANVQAFKSDPVAAAASEPPTITRMVIAEDETDPSPEEVEVNMKTVITSEGAFSEEEWAGRTRTDTIVTGDGQTVFSGVGDTDAIDEELSATAEQTAVAENEATTDPYGDVETQQIVYDTADAIDSPGQSAGGTLVVPAEAEDLDQAIDQMNATSQQAENQRVAETAVEAGDEGEGDEPAATTGAQEAADELGVDLSTVEGTGKGGKITKADVEQAANG